MRQAEANVGLLLVQLCRAHRNRLSAALSGLGLHVGQEHAVFQLGLQDGIPQSQLASNLFIDVSTATKMLLRLERDGLIERRADETDARVWLVHLTPKGKALVQPVIAVWSDIEAQLLSNFTDAEQALLRRMLLQLTTNLS
jgi:DNA-binding MarR family transcriptional regulator